MASMTADLAPTITDGNIAQFLASKHWTIQRDRGFDQTWVQPGAAGDYVSVVHLPRDKTMVDYRRRIGDVIETISNTFRWSAAATAEQVASVRADLFFIRLDQHSSDGTIPLKQASSLLAGIDQMIRSAALVTNNPLATGRGRQPGLVTDFLTDNVRMGHTKHGSFIITVAARLGEEELRSAEPSGGDVIPSFTRQVMTTLARSLEATKMNVGLEVAERLNAEQVAERGVRLPFVQALESLADAEGLRALDMSFEWAPIEPQRVEVPTRVVLERAELDELPKLREQFKREDVEREETLVGPVIELKRAEGSGGDEQGEVVVRADVDNRLVRVTVPLSGTDYDWAIRAHREHLPFTVSGELGRKGNSWHLVRNIEVDTEYLEHHFESTRAQ